MLIDHKSALICLAVCMAMAGAQAEETAGRERLFTHTRVNVGHSEWTGGTVSSRASGLTFVPTFDSSISSDKNSAAIMATINAALTELASNYSDPVTINVTFKNVKSGLGASLTSYTTVAYTDFLTALKAHATTADDATALANTPAGPTNPVNGDPSISLTLPNARALGFSADNGGGPDSTISLNISLMNITSSNTDPTKYSLRETALHELTEVMGSSSALDSGTVGPVTPIDLFRYDQKGSRTYTQDPTGSAYFCLDGKTMRAQFNQDKSGDFGDYFSINGNQKPQIQDAFGTPGASNLQLSAELVELDVVGYTRIMPGGATPANSAAPTITSPASCNPNPAFVGGMTSFSVGASDPANSPLTIGWDFGDGAKGSDPQTSHVYATGGTYTATATAVNAFGLSTSSSVTVNVSATMLPANSVKKSFMLNFKFPNDQGGQTSGKDKIDITLQNNDFTNAADGTQIQFMVGNIIFDQGTLQNKKAFGDFGKFTLNVRSGTLRYTASNTALQYMLSLFGAVNDNVSASLQIPVSFMFNNGIYGSTLSFSYAAVAGKTGKGK